MKSLKAYLSTFAAIVVLSGCNPSDTAANSPDTTSKENVASTAGVENAKCEGCGNDVPKATLVSHDGKMMCKPCIDAHGH